MPELPAKRELTQARDKVIRELKSDHRRVRQAYRLFKQLEIAAEPRRCEGIVQQVCAELTMHSALEEELLYPAARAAVADVELIEEAEVEHESLRLLIDALRAMDASDAKFAARFIVLCEYVLHHVKEEESRLFPQLQRSRLDWTGLAAKMDRRRAELTPSFEGESLDPASSPEAPESDSERVPALQIAAHASPRRGPAATPKATGTGGGPGGAATTRRGI